MTFLELLGSHAVDFTKYNYHMNSNGPKMSFLVILETLNFEFW